MARTPEHSADDPANRRARLKAAFNAALSCQPEHRPQYLAMLYAGSTSLAGEVSRYLRNFHEAGDLLEPETVTPGVAASAPVATSGAFSPSELVADRFRIVRLIGQGGMGEVYEAIDLVLRVPVALKTIRTDFAADAATRARFLRELQLARRVAHPNVCRTYELWKEERGSSEIVFLTMELLEGETLADWLKREARLPPATALPVLEQLAAALDAIHELNIIHRDLKPANVYVVPDGPRAPRVVVTDFGLARMTAHDATFTSALAGTPAYMAPEQFDAGECSVASDVYAFGVICFEMLTGQRQPIVPPRTLNPALHERWEDFILRCLAQDPRKRPNGARALRAELSQLSGVHRRFVGWRVIRGVPLVAMLSLALVAVMGVLLLGSRASVSSPEFTRLTFDSGLSWDPSVSRDGKRVVYSSDRGDQSLFQIWSKTLPDGDPVQLTQTGAHAVSPAISADGRQVVFRGEQHNGGLYVVSASGGPERLVAPNGRHPRFSPDGSRIVYWTGVEGDHSYASGKLWVVNTAGGPPQQLRPELADARFPTWSPDGRWILFRGSATTGPRWDEMSDWWVTDPQGRTLEPTGAFAQLGALRLSLHDGALVWEPGRIIFSARAGHSTNLWSVGISDETGRIDGVPLRLTSGPNLETSPWPVSDGLIAYTNWGASGQIWRVWTAGPRAGEAEPLTRTDALDTRPTLSADGARLVFTRRLGEVRNLWFKDLTTGRESLIVSGLPLVPALSPNAREIAYSLNENQKRRVYVMPAQGGTGRRVCDDCGELQGWSPDGSAVLYVRQAVGGKTSLESVDVEAGRSRVLVAGALISEGMMSPDGRFIAFAVRTGGTESRVHVAPLAPAAPSASPSWLAITPEHEWTDKARWAPDGTAVYYYSSRDGFGCIWRQAMSDGRAIGAPTPVRHLHEARRAVLHLSRQAFGISAGPDFVAYNVPNAGGNLWTMTYAPQAPSGFRTLWGWLPGAAR
jgi:serine/threonine protein kinase